PAGGHVLGGLQRGRTTTADGGRRPEPPPRRDRSPGGPGAEVRRRDPPVVRGLRPVRRGVEALSLGHAGTSHLYSSVYVVKFRTLPPARWTSKRSLMVYSSPSLNSSGPPEPEPLTL